ncbi:MAG TPA: dTMP kinase, partial [Parachlamydiaceae bacterium]|nr:dTMP kinase [Parachlamydiaceae bacterium]
MLITFEGGEGAGKTTLIKELAKALFAVGHHVVQTREPGGSRLGEHIRSWLLKHDFDVKVGKEAELLLFLAARAQHLEELIVPSIKAGKIVLCDRFNDSTIVYQGIARGIGFEKVEKLCQLVSAHTEPALTLLLDVDPVIGLMRTKKAS